MVTITITVTVEIGKENFADFSDLVKSTYNEMMRTGREIIRTMLESLDLTLMAQRDSKRYRAKGLRQTCIKTLLGEVEYKRRLYTDNTVTEGSRSVYLLDETLGIDTVGLMPQELSELMAALICENTYRNTAGIVSELTGLHITHQSAWTVVQAMGEKRGETIERFKELNQKEIVLGKISTPVLYEEEDGIWLKLQGKDRKANGPSKEMKVGIAYDGATWEENTRTGIKRRTLDNKVAYATFDSIKDFRAAKEGVIASRYDTTSIDLRILNGDGAQWIQKRKGQDILPVLDQFHRNREAFRRIKDTEFRRLFLEKLCGGETELALDCLEAQIHSIGSVSDRQDEVEDLKKLFVYFNENKAALSNCYQRGVEIPPTREPGVVHHARLGSMESNVFTLIGNRMKGRRHCWSISGANNLARLLCMKHTTGLEDLFKAPPSVPDSPPEERNPLDFLPLVTAGKAPRHDGRGYEYPVQARLTNAPFWLRDIASAVPLSDLALRF